jgi:uncharacterized protein (TIGR00661 family)
MRILYGVVGEGMGHAIRSKVLLDRLVQRHDVHVMVSNRAHDLLARHFSGVQRIWGLTMAYEENEVQKRLTALENLRGALTGLPSNVAAYFELLGRFEPEVVLSDFESWTYVYAKAHGLPVVSVDNMQAINRCAHDPALLVGSEAEFQLAKAVVKAKLPFANHYIVSTFFDAPVRKERTTLVPPILRPEILTARSTARDGSHLLVYQSADANPDLSKILEASGLECRIYGLRRGRSGEIVEGRLRYRPFDEASFIEDLATCRAVVAGGGHTLMGEAIYLRKPMLSVPIEGQFEQVLNAKYLQKLGYGRWASRLSLEALSEFIAALPECRRALAGYDQDGNEQVFSVLDELLVRAEAGVL